MILRGGWYYEPSPVPNQDGVWNILDNDKNVFTGGLGLRIGDLIGLLKTPVDIDGNFQWHRLEPRTIENDDDPAFPKIETDGNVISWTVSVELEW
ncbi:MAG: outer membrane protein transport protein [Deltaproteobacteria bacterium]|nr:outer membrane protein transport protein [Deltaproteobacteria bacterium]